MEIQQVHLLSRNIRVISSWYQYFLSFNVHFFSIY